MTHREGTRTHPEGTETHRKLNETYGETPPPPPPYRDAVLDPNTIPRSELREKRFHVLSIKIVYKESKNGSTHELAPNVQTTDMLIWSDPAKKIWSWAMEYLDAHPAVKAELVGGYADDDASLTDQICVHECSCHTSCI